MSTKNLKSELQSLIKDKSPSVFIKSVTDTLKVLASNGKTSTTIGSSRYDKETIDYLRNQGLVVTEFSDPRDGDYIKVEW